MTLDLVLQAVVKYTGITVEQMKKRTNVREISDARHLYCFACKYFQSSLRSGYSLSLVGEKINRHHTTVLHSQKIYSNLMEYDFFILKDFEGFKDSFKNKWWITKITQKEADRIIRRSIGSYEIIDS